MKSHLTTVLNGATLLCAIGLCTIQCAPSTPAGEPPSDRLPSRPPAAVEPVELRGTTMVIDRPSSWWIGGSTGFGVLFNYIGTGDGYPSFAVQTDPDAGAQPTATAERAIDDLFDAIAEGRASNQVVFADWTEINRIRAHSSLMTFSSIAGKITVRRLLVSHRGRPYIFSWSAREADYESIEPLVEWCISTLRLQAAQATTAG